MAYATRDDVELIFGAQNVSSNGGWADIDNDNNQATITARIVQALVVAESRIDALLFMGPYDIPFASAPVQIVDATAKLAGVWLYEHRGIADFDPKSGFSTHKLMAFKAEAEQLMKDVFDNKVRFDLDEAEDVPAVVKN